MIAEPDATEIRPLGGGGSPDAPEEGCGFTEVFGGGWHPPAGGGTGRRRDRSEWSCTTSATSSCAVATLTPE